MTFELGISKGCRTILQNFKRLKLVSSRISKGKVTNLKILEEDFQNTISSTPPVWIFCDNFSMVIATELYSEKILTVGRDEDMEFLGDILKKYNAEIPRVN